MFQRIVGVTALHDAQPRPNDSFETPQIVGLYLEPPRYETKLLSDHRVMKIWVMVDGVEFLRLRMKEKDLSEGFERVEHWFNLRY